MKKRLLVFAALMLCFALPLSAMAEFAFVQLGSNVYAEADATSAVVSSYDAGTWVEIAQDDDSEFVSVVGPDGITGYVPNSAIFVLSQTDASQIAVVANGGKFVNLRAEASKKAKVLAKINSGTPMTLLSAGKSFDNVQVGELQGYMVAGMLKTGLKPIYSPIVRSSNGKSVNLRSEPTMNGDVLATVPCESSVNVYMLGGGWAYAQYKNVDGYIMSKFLTSSSPTPTMNPVPNPNPDGDFWDVNLTCYVSNGGSSVRYRNGPGGSAKVLGKLSSGSEVFVLSTNGAWSKITIGYGGNPVYMMAKYLVTVMPDVDDPTDPIVIEDDPIVDESPIDSGD